MAEEIYERLRQKLDALTKGYPKTEKGSEMVFLKKVFSPEDADLFIRMKRGLQTPAQVAADLLVLLPFGQQVQHFELAIRQHMAQVRRRRMRAPRAGGRARRAVPVV